MKLHPRNLWTALLVAVAMLLAPSNASADMLDFEDLYNNRQELNPLPAGYGGFIWNSDSWYITKYLLPGTGYDVGTMGEVSLFTAYARDIRVHDGLFDFNGCYITSAWDASQFVRVDGYANGQLLYSQRVEVFNHTAIWFDFEYLGIDTLVFNPDQWHIAIDDFVFNDFPDLDDDGVADDEDNCPLVANADQADADGDGFGDVCDDCPYDAANDIDGDGLCADVDNCPLDANADQFDNDGDGFGDVCDDDDDNDGVLDGDDNCQYDANADQADYDGDGAGDVCDADDDGDGVIDATDQCLWTVPGAVVNDTGCSIADLCPCDNGWKNHGGYVSCVAQTSEDFVDFGLITDVEKDAIVSEAGGSDCGHKRR